ncbi:MAG: minor capsid protein [Defluviitaleaceae bacterium]|nr:minor capsid protein [Defluviitaleaceae bacterium]MCL2273409.1 minor capsid protein [Defluviitaleaceae bacterium]
MDNNLPTNEGTKEHFIRNGVLLNEMLLGKADAFCQTIGRKYEIALSRIYKEIEAFFNRYATDGELMLADARQRLSQNELRRYRAEVEEYMLDGERVRYFPDYEDTLRTASTAYYVTRLEALELQTRQHVEELYIYYLRGLQGAIYDIYTEGYYRSLYEAQRTINYELVFALLITSQVKEAIATPWSPDGTTFSEKIWRDRNELVAFLDRELTQALVRGDGAERLITELQRKFDVTRSNATRLIRTEAAHFTTLSKINAFKEMGYTSYFISAIMDMKTSEICAEMDGKEFPIEAYRPGVTAPPLHPNCRSSVSETAPPPASNIANATTDNTNKDITYMEFLERFSITITTERPANWSSP